MSELKKCPFCGSEAMNLYDDDVEMVGCPNTDCVEFDAPMVNVASWQTRPLEDALKARIAELEAENKALRIIAGSHSMSELRRNKIMAGDKWFKYPPSPEQTKGDDNV